MGEVLELHKQRQRMAARRGFQSWAKRFSERFDEDTRPVDLSDGTLAALIKGGQEASVPLYEFTMGVMGLGSGTRFQFLENAQKMVVMDAAVFLLDQLRFEAMRRLEWVEDFATLHVPLVELIEGFSSRFALTRQATPELSTRHPRFDEYRSTFEGDRSRFIRRLIPEVIQTFEQSPPSA